MVGGDIAFQPLIHPAAVALDNGIVRSIIFVADKDLRRHVFQALIPFSVQDFAGFPPAVAGDHHIFQHLWIPPDNDRLLALVIPFTDDLIYRCFGKFLLAALKDRWIGGDLASRDVFDGRKPLFAFDRLDGIFTDRSGNGNFLNGIGVQGFTV